MDAQNNPVAGIFDGGSDWFFPSAEKCKRANISPNMLAFCETSETLALVVKKSFTGQDFALSEAGLLYLEATLGKGALKDGRPVSAAYVVMAAVDDSMPVEHRSPRLMKVVDYSSAEERRERLNGQPAYPGKFGPFWWITAGTLSDGDEAF